MPSGARRLCEDTLPRRARTASDRRVRWSAPDARAHAGIVAGVRKSLTVSPPRPILGDTNQFREPPESGLLPQVPRTPLVLSLAYRASLRLNISFVLGFCRFRVQTKHFRSSSLSPQPVEQAVREAAEQMAALDFLGPRCYPMETSVV